MSAAVTLFMIEHPAHHLHPDGGWGDHIEFYREELNEYKDFRKLDKNQGREGSSDQLNAILCGMMAIAILDERIGLTWQTVAQITTVRDLNFDPD